MTKLLLPIAIFFAFSGSVQLWSMPLHPAFAERLRKEGRLETVLRDYRDAQARRHIDRLPGDAGRRADRMNPSARSSLICGSGIAILIDFPDDKADIIRHQPGAYDTLLFSENILRSGSMRDFYNENSFGRFKFTGAVAPKPPAANWFRSARTMAYYGEYYGFAHGAELIQEAVSLADPSTDFSRFDNDGPDGVPNSGDDDGVVDALYLVHAGPGYEENGCGKIWSHMSYIDLTTDDQARGGGRIRIGPYSIQPEERCSGDLISIGVFCHEYGHILGIPDLYDYGYDSNGAGRWTVMASGSWNGAAGSAPAHFDAWCKTRLGWLDPIVVTNFRIGAEIPEIERNPVAYRLWTGGAAGDQYFLVENRQLTGKFDRYLPGSGLLVYHVDEGMAGSNNDNQYIPGVSAPGSPHYLVAVEQADGQFALERNLNSGDPGDPFPGTTNRGTFAGVLPYPTTFDYSEHDTKVGVLNITPSDSLMRADLDVGRYLPLLKVTGFTVDDKSGGDGDGRVEPGENITISVDIGNSWGPASNVTGQLSSPDSALSVVNAAAAFGSITSGGSANNRTNPFTCTVSPGAVSHPAELVLRLTTSIAGYTKFDTFDLMIGWPNILIVDDDGGDTVDLVYRRALDSLDLKYDYWNIAGQGSPPPEWLAVENADSIIIWCTGRSAQTLSPGERLQLTGFLNGGGRLLLSSENCGQELSTDGFLADYLHARFIAPNAATPFVLGVDGDPISMGDTLATSYLLADSKDVIAPIDPATTVFTYKDVANGAAAIKYSGSYQVVYCAFPIEAATGNPTKFLLAKEFIRRTLVWFGVPVGIEENTRPVTNAPALSVVARPNPGRDVIDFEFHLSRAGGARLTIYDSEGRLVTTLFDDAVRSPASDPNRGRVRWRTGHLAAGVYFCRLTDGRSSTVDKVILLR